MALIMVFASASYGGTFVALRSEPFVRHTGRPVTETVSFAALNPNTAYTLRLFNGGPDGQLVRVSSAVLRLNGVQVMGPRDFNQNVAMLERSVTLLTDNTLEVELRGKPDGTIILEIIGIDNDLPTLTATIDPPPNVAGWHRTPATVHFVCMDRTSSIVICSDPVTVTTEGANQVVTGRAVDQAGNEAILDVTLNIDTTPPSLSGNLDPSPNSSGWHQADVTVRFEATDALSGIANVTPPEVVTTAGAHQQINGTATDHAGNSSTTTVTVSLDKTAPSLRLTSPPDGTLRNDPQLTVAGTVSDALSGLAAVTCNDAAASVSGSTLSCTPPLHEGINEITARATDLAGNVTTDSIRVTLDTIPPVATITSPAAGSFGNSSPITVTGTVDDDTAVVTVNGVAATVSQGIFAAAAVPLAEGANTLTVTAADAAGNTSTVSSEVFLDTVPPTLTATVEPLPNPAGWHNADATVRFQATDNLSGIATVTDPVTLTTEGSGQVVSGTAIDRAGNSSTTTVTVSLDKTTPSLHLTSPPDGTLRNDPQLTVTGTVSDALSGLDAVTCNDIAASVPGSALSCALLLSEGINHIEVRATDVAGNTATANRTVTLDTTAPVVTITAPQVGALLNGSPITVTGTLDDPTATVEVNGIKASASGGTFTAAGVPLVEGPNVLSATATDAAGNVGTASRTVTLDTTPPQFTVNTPLNNAVIFEPQVQVAGSIDDNTAQVRVNGQAATVHDGQWDVVAVPLTLGANTITIVATDAAGNSSQHTLHLTRQEPVLQAITVSPSAIRMTEVGAVRPLTVTGHLSNGATQNLTVASTGTVYGTNNRFVASVSADGVVTAVGNGAASITASHEAFSAAATVTVEAGVTLEALDVSPTTITLRTAGATQQLSLHGTYSDGSSRDVTAASTGTTYESSEAAVATVSADGLVTAVADGTSVITARHEHLSTEALATVVISSGAGFLRGEVYDDTKGRPLAEATITLLADGSGPLATPLTTTADAYGQFVLPGRAGDALVRIAKDNFTSAERRGAIPRDTAFTLLDARLTPLDPHPNPITSAFGGQARNAADTLALDLVAGSLAVDTDVRLTEISNQGLQGRLPPGWSPIAVVDVQPPGLTFVRPAELRVPNTRNLPGGSEVTTAFYDTQVHSWIGVESAQVTADGAHLALPLHTSGQVALLLPDTAPSVPPAAQIGQLLQGVAPLPLPAEPTATGEVVPRSAPPGKDVRATGTIVLETAEPLPSGTLVQAHVSERYDLLDTSSVVPLPFTQDLLLYAQPRSGNAPALSTRFPITPSRTFTILELELGVVQLDVTAPEAAVGGMVVGVAGGSAADAAGNSVDIPTGALTTDTVLDLRPLTAEQVLVPPAGGFALLGAVQLDLAAADLAQTATLSLPRPTTLPDAVQVLIARVITDPAGIRRLRLVALGEVQATRIVSRTAINGSTLPGITGGGQYVFLQPDAPLGFIAGQVFGTDASTPQSLVLVTADTAPFADVTGTDGGYVVAGAVGTVQVTALLQASGDAVTNAAAIAAAPDVVGLDLTLSVVAPTVVSIRPEPDAVDVPLDTSLVVRFSEAIAAVTIDDASVVLEREDGTPVNGQRVLAPDGRTLSFIPGGGLASGTVYRLTLTAALRDLTGNALTPPPAVTFTTVDTSKPPQPEAGQITAALPDEDGMVVVFGTQGTAEPGSAVTLTNFRTQETVTVLAQTLPQTQEDGSLSDVGSLDGSFRLRIAARLGDALGLTFRTATGREQTLQITQFEDTNGTTSFGSAGGFFEDAEGRVGRVLPRALRQAGLFKLDTPRDTVTLPALPSSDFSLIDAFDLTVEDAEFSRLRSLTLTESQNRLPPQRSAIVPFEASGAFFVPANFLINGRLTFEAAAEDIDGNLQRVPGSTLVIASGPDTTPVETSAETRFPAAFLTVPTEAIPNQQVLVHAIAPTARIDFEIPPPPGLDPDAALLLVRPSELGGEATLAIVDRLERVDSDGTPVLRTSGRALPGATRGGRYAVVAYDESAVPLAEVRGRLSGPAAVVRLDGTPFTIETDGPNANFVLPVPTGPFTLSFVDPVTDQILGTASGQAPADLGELLAPIAEPLLVSIQPDAESLAEITAPVVFRFSEPIDNRTVTAQSIAVTDTAGNRVFGRFSLPDDARMVTFRPLRRWAFGRTYHYGVTRDVLALSGARLAQPVRGEFTTFAPRLLGQAAVDTARDVAVSGNLALVGGDAGVSVLDLTQPDRPVLLAQLPVDGGVSGVALLTAASFDDRNGQPVTGTLGFAAGGDATTAGTLQIFDLATPASPALIGSAQLTVPMGQSAPSGVPDFPGVPSCVALTPDHRALVAVQSIGVESVDLVQAIPVDAGEPGRALGPRYPDAAFESVRQVAILGEFILAAGSQGLTILDDTTLAKVSNVMTAGDATGVAALSGFGMDLDGNGIIDPGKERLDLAVVATGAGRTLQFFDLRDTSNPVLLSVVRLQGVVNSVALDRAEQLAYAGGLNGLVIVDLAGPPSVQPLDLDRNGVDDRILGTVETGAAAGRLALDPGRGVGYVVDSTYGLTVVQLVPPRVSLADVLRDPLLGATGDENSILDSREAFLSDDALQIRLNTVLPPQADLLLAVEETPVGGGPALAAFEGGATSVPLQPGENALSLRIAKAPGAVGSQVSLKIEEAGGRVVERFDLQLVAADPQGATLELLFASPEHLFIPGDATAAQLGVGGVFSDGRVFNLSSASSGTAYRLDNAAVVALDADGGITPLAGGATSVFVSNQGFEATARIEVGRPPVVTALEVLQPFVTLTAPGAQQPLAVRASLSNGLTTDVAAAADTSYSVSPAGIVSVSGDGVITANAEGAATITVTNGSFTAPVNVVVEFRVVPDVTSIDLRPFTEPVTTDVPQATAIATITGTGSLEGLPVTFTLGGANASEITGLTDGSGVAMATFVDLHIPDAATVTASVVHPTSGSSLSDAEMLVVQAGSGDIEPNDDPAAARLIDEHDIAGTVGGPGDPQDVFAVEHTTAGTVAINLTVPVGTTLGDLAIVVRLADGTELARHTPDQASSRFVQQLDHGRSFISLEAAGVQIPYQLFTSFVPADVVITAVNPTSGGPGTLVTITGSGFSTDPAENVVIFGGGAGKVVAANANQLQVEVPAQAVDDALLVLAGARAATGPFFTAGNTVLPPIEFSPPDPTTLRFDPVTGVVINGTRLRVNFDPLVERSVVESMANSHGGTIVGSLPTFNTYILEFPAVQTLAALEAILGQLEADARVASAAFSTVAELATGGNVQDTRDRSVGWGDVPVSTAAAYAQANFFEAVDAVRRTPPFDDATNLKKVKVAIIDTGFDPQALDDEFKDRAGNVVVKLLDAFNGRINPTTGRLEEAPSLADPHGHGTEVTSIIAAMNNDKGLMGGMYHSLWQPDETPNSEIVVYRVADDFGRIHTDAVMVALEDIRRDLSNIDVVNLSFGTAYQGSTRQQSREVAAYVQHFSVLQPFMLIVMAAGNGAQNDLHHVPSNLGGLTSGTSLMSIGAAAVANADRTGEFVDQRAVYRNGGTNFGQTLAMAAPGEDLIVAIRRDPGNPHAPAYGRRNGTSYATPLVTAAAAMLQAIRPDAAKIPPSALKRTLVRTGDEIIQAWDPNPFPLPGASMKRLNVLSAVLERLTPPDSQPVYIVDQEADDDPNDPDPPPGKLIALELDPLTGKTVPNKFAKEIPLTVTRGTHTFTGTRPTAVAVSPAGHEAFVVVESTNPAEGDGLLVIDTGRQQAVDFIPFSGADWPPAANQAPLPAVKAATNKPGMTFSKDGRLLYIAPTNEILVMNVAARQIVRRLSDIPFPYNGGWTPQVAAGFVQHRWQLRTEIAMGIPRADGSLAPGQVFSDLTFTPDGRTLLAAMVTGGGGGIQPGAILALNADLYTDLDERLSGLQAKLDSYFDFAIPSHEFLVMQDTVANTAGDEPKAIMASEDGNFVYLLNGGVDAFVGVPPEPFDAASWIATFGAAIFGGVSLGQVGGLQGLLAGINGVNTQFASFYDAVVNDYTSQLNAGRTLLRSGGFTGVFRLKPGQAAQPGDPVPAAGEQEFLFPATVVFGWNAPPSGGGRIVNQFQFREVFAERPFAVALRPDGKRAIAPMFQTGNFCVLDLEAQKKFQTVPVNPLPAFDSLPESMFQGWVACTPALALDNHLYPGRGVVRVLHETQDVFFDLPSPDNPLLFTWDSVYAQNQRYTIATHAGDGQASQKIRFRLPPFENFVTQALPFLAIGFEVPSTDPFEVRDPDGNVFGANDIIEVERHGGAITILNDKAITDALNANIEDLVSFGNDERAYFATNPLCKTVLQDSAGNPIPNLCAEEVLEHLFVYQTAPDTEKHFRRPRGVDRQPFVTFEAPRFGDHVGPTKALHVLWRDAQIAAIQFKFHEFDASTNTYALVGQTADLPLSPEQQRQRAYSEIFHRLFRDATNASPVDKTRYRIEVLVKNDSADDVSSERIEVFYEDLREGRADQVDYDTQEEPQPLFPNDPPGSAGTEILAFPTGNAMGVVAVDAQDAFLHSVSLTRPDGTVKTFESADGYNLDEPVVLFRDRDYNELCVNIGRVEIQAVCFDIDESILQDEARFTGSLAKLKLVDRTNGALIRQLHVPIIPATIDGPAEFVIRTRVDRVNQRSCLSSRTFRFRLNVDAKVTLQLRSGPDPVIKNAWDSTRGNPIPRFENIPFTAGTYDIELFSDNVGPPGRNDYELIATDIVGYPGETIDDEGAILHEVEINETFPIGHTMIKHVDIWDGRLTHAREDVRIPGRGLSLAFRRSYSSAGDASSGPLGAGWTHSYNIRLVHDPNCGTYTVYGGEGTGNSFTKDSQSGTFIPQIGYHSTLVESPGGGFDFYTKARVRYHFELQPLQVTQFGLQLTASTYTLRFIEEPNGNRITLTYATPTSSAGAGPALPVLSEVRDSSGRVLVFTYEPIYHAQRLRKLEGRDPQGTNLLGLVIRYGYDDKGNLISVTREGTSALNDQRSEAYSYTAGDVRFGHNLLTYTDPNGHTTEYVYYADASGFTGTPPTYNFAPAALQFGLQPHEIVRQVIEPDGLSDSGQRATTTFDKYDFVNNKREVSDPRSPRLAIPKTIYTLNVYGATERIEAPLNKTTEMTWCIAAPSSACPRADGSAGRDVLMTSKTDALGRVHTYMYDHLGNLAEETIIFNGINDATIAQVRDANGAAPSSVTTTTVYDPTFSKAISKTDAEGNTTFYQIDSGTYTGPQFCPGGGGNTGNLLGTRDAEDNVTCHTYYANGDLQSITDPRGFQTQYTRYDAYGNAEEVRAPENFVTTNVFDVRSRLRDRSDTFGHHTVYFYDGLDRTIEKRRLEETGDTGTHQITTYRYQANGEPALLIDGLGQHTEYQYDGLNRKRKAIERNLRQADGTTVDLMHEYFYDEVGNLIGEIDARGVEYAHEYDALSRRTFTRVVSGPSTAGPTSTITMSYTYDLVNNKRSATDIHGHQTRYVYDGLYRVVETHLPFTNAVIETGYDLVGNRVRETDANGQPKTYVYDDIYRVLETTDADGNTVVHDYDRASNKILEHNLSSGLKTEWPSADYDGLNRPTFMRQTVPMGGANLSTAVYETSFDYQDGQNAVVITNPRNFKVRTDKDGLDRTFRIITDFGGLDLTTTYSYDGNGNVASVQDPEGSEPDVAHTYDGLNRKIRSVYVRTPDDNGRTVDEKFFYDGNNNLVRYQDKRGIVFLNTYDNIDRPLSKKLVESLTNGGAELTALTSTYDDANSRVIETDANGNVTVTTYDGLHRPESIDDPDPAGLIVHEYDGVNKRAETDKKGQRTEFDYDNINRLVDTREFDRNGALRTTLHVEYFDEENRVEETDRRGITSIRQLDALQRLVQFKRRGLDMAAHYGADTVLLETHEYDGNNNRTGFIDAQGHRTESTYDGADRQETVTEGVGSAVEATTTTTYDRANNVLTVKDGRAHGGAFDVQYTYDARYRRISITNGEGETSTQSFDANDNLVRLTEPEGPAFTTRYRYDEMNTLLAVDETPRADANTAAGVTRFFYDGNRNKIAQQDANGNLVTYTYDGLNRLTDTFQHTVAGALSDGTARGSDPRGSELSAGGDEASALHWQVGYDLNSNPNLIIDARGQRVDKTYDYLDRLETATYSNHAEAGLDFQMQAIAYGYDGNSNVTCTTETKRIAGSDVTELTVNRYDPLDRLQVRVHRDHDDSSGQPFDCTDTATGKRLEYDYDVQGNRTAVIDPDGTQTDYTFDARNRLETATTEAGVTTYAWWEDNLLKQVTYANGTVADRSAADAYDRADRILRIVNRPTDQTQPAFSVYEYTYDDNGNRTQQIETQAILNGGVSEATTYTYDNLNRLRSVTYGSGATLTYTYAPNGNRLTEVGTDPHTGQAVDRAYRYEALPGKPGVTFDRVNALTQIVDHLDSSRTITYEYDTNLNQMSKAKGAVRTEYRFGIRDQILQADEQSGATVRFDYDADRMRVKKVSGGSGSDTRYLYDQNAVLVEYNGNDTALSTVHKYDYGYELLSLTQVTNAGQDRDSEFYLVDGLMSTANLTDESGGLLQSYRYDAWGRVRDQSGSSDNPRQYTGHYKDDETGLHYFGARYYDDETGRFLSQDAYLGEPATPPSLHRYLYAYANPLRFVDLIGYAAEEQNETAKKKSKKEATKEDVIFELRNTVIDPKTGKHYDAWWSDRKVIAENQKEIARPKSGIEDLLGPLSAALDRAEKEQQAQGIEEQPGAYDEYLYRQAGGPLQDKKFLHSNMYRPRAVYDEDGNHRGYKRSTPDVVEYYDPQGNFIGETAKGIESEGLGPLDYVVPGKAGVKIGVNLVRAGTKKLITGLVRAGTKKLITGSGAKVSTKLLSAAGEDVLESELKLWAFGLRKGLYAASGQKAVQGGPCLAGSCGLGASMLKRHMLEMFPKSAKVMQVQASGNLVGQHNFLIGKISKKYFIADPTFTQLTSQTMGLPVKGVVDLTAKNKAFSSLERYGISFFKSRRELSSAISAYKRAGLGKLRPSKEFEELLEEGFLPSAVEALTEGSVR